MLSTQPDTNLRCPQVQRHVWSPTLGTSKIQAIKGPEKRRGSNSACTPMLSESQQGEAAHLPHTGCSPAPAEQVTQFSLKGVAFSPYSGAVTKPYPASSTACTFPTLKKSLSSCECSYNVTSKTAKGPVARLPSSFTPWPHENHPGQSESPTCRNWVHANLLHRQVVWLIN